MLLLLTLRFDVMVYMKEIIRIIHTLYFLQALIVILVIVNYVVFHKILVEIKYPGIPPIWMN
jgi:hypothetical protein